MISIVILTVAALASDMSLEDQRSISTLELDEVLELTELAFQGHVVSTELVEWHGPADAMLGQLLYVDVDDNLFGSVESGLVAVWMPAMSNVPLVGSRVLVLAHSKRFACEVAGCSRNPLYAVHTPYSDVVTLATRGSLFFEPEAEPEAGLAVSAYYPRNPEWMAPLTSWAALIDYLTSAIDSRDMQTQAIALPGVVP